MPKTDADLIAAIAGGQQLTAETELSPGYRGELMRLMVVFVDSELAGAAGFVDFINFGPGLKERTTAARIVAEKFGHAEQVLTLLEKFGVNPNLYIRSHPWTARLDRELDLGNRRQGGDKRLNVFWYPLEGWIDAVTLNMLMGMATAVQLHDLTTCSYAPLAEVMTTIAVREAEHARLGETGLGQIIERSGATLRAQAVINYWYPRVAATFGRLDSARYDLYRSFGLRSRTNADMLAKWEGDMAVRLESLGLAVPTA